jgi:hypothetical protein
MLPSVIRSSQVRVLLCRDSAYAFSLIQAVIRSSQVRVLLRDLAYAFSIIQAVIRSSQVHVLLRLSLCLQYHTSSNQKFTSSCLACLTQKCM